MAVTREELEKIKSINVKEHGHIVDSFTALGRDPETIAIRQGIDLELVVLIIKAYNFQLGKAWGQEEDDLGSNKRTAEALTKAYVQAYYPGICTEEKNYENISFFEFLREGAK